MFGRSRSLLNHELIFISIVLAIVLMFFYRDIVFMGRSFITAPKARAGVMGTGPYGFTGARGTGYSIDTGAIAYQFEPWTELIRHDYRQYELPLWNPHQGLGSPLLGNAQSTPFDPLVMFVYLVPDSLLISAIDLHLLLEYFIGGLFTYLLLRKIRVSRVGATAAAIAYILSSYFVLRGNIVYVRADMLLPMLIYGCHLLAHQPSWKTFIFAVLALTLIILAGFPETLPLQLGFAGVWYILQILMRPQAIRLITLRNMLARFVALVMCALLLSAFALLPFVEYLRLADQGHHPSSATAVSLTEVPYILMTYLIPSDPTPRYASPQKNLEVWALVLALSGFLAVITHKKPATPTTHIYLLFFVAFMAILMLIAANAPLVVYIRSLPLLNMIVLENYLIPLISFCVACAAGIGLDLWLVDKIQLPEVSRVVGFLFLMVLTLGFVIPFDDPVLQPKSDTIVIYFICVSLAFYGLTLLKDSWPGAGSYLAWVIVLGLALLPALWYRGYEHSQRHNPFRKPPYVTFLEEQPEPYRVVGLGGYLYPNLASAFGIDDVRYLDAVFPAQYVRYLKDLVFKPRERARFVGTEEIYLERGLNMLNVEYIIAPEGKRKLKNLESVPSFAATATSALTIEGASHRVIDPASSPAWSIRVPTGSPTLMIGFALSPEVWKCECTFLDGASFEVDVTDATALDSGEQTVFRQSIDPVHSVADRRWFTTEVDLAAWSGHEVQIRLVKTGSPGDNLSLAYWGVPTMKNLDFPNPDRSNGDIPLTDFFSSATSSISGDNRPAVFSQPPSDFGIELQLPDTEDIALEFGTGFDEALWSAQYADQNLGDGVTFSVTVSDQRDEQVVYRQYIDPKNNPEQRRWNDAHIDLSPWKGERIHLRFDTDGGPQGDATFDWAYWSNIRVTGDPTALASLTVTSSHLYPVYEDDAVTIYRNPHAFPRAFIVHEAETVKGLQQALDRLNDADFNPSQTVLIEGALPSVIDRKLSDGHGYEGSSQAQVLGQTANTLKIQVTTEQPGFLVLSEQYFPGWKAYVDGNESTIYEANGTMRAVFLDAGAHKVEFRYRPFSFILGTLISGATFLTLLVVYVLGKARGSGLGLNRFGRG